HTCVYGGVVTTNRRQRHRQRAYTGGDRESRELGFREVQVRLADSGVDIQVYGHAAGQREVPTATVASGQAGVAAVGRQGEGSHATHDVVRALDGLAAQRHDGPLDQLAGRGIAMHMELGDTGTHRDVGIRHPGQRLGYHLGRRHSAAQAESVRRYAVEEHTRDDGTYDSEEAVVAA